MFIRTVKVIEVGREGDVIHYMDKTNHHYYLDTTDGSITDEEGIGENGCGRHRISVKLEVVKDFITIATIA